MGKPTGFIEYKRELPKEREPLKRIRDWNEFGLAMPESSLKKQGARCMDCGVAFCHSGMMLNGMASGCPINNLIPEWNDLVYRGLWKQAYERLAMTNDFAEFTGRVCPAPCEGSCTLGINEPPVTIKNIECAIIDKAYEQGWVVPNPPLSRTGKKVAVVGSGPAGLACAHELNKMGHIVTVFEKEDKPGGLLMYGIPNMKLDKGIVLRRIELMKQEGIEFVLGTEMGTDENSIRILSDFDAAVLCCGAGKPRDLKLKGRDLKNIYFALDFLKANTKRLLDGWESDKAFISAKDKKVVVIGGGDTGTDCVAVSLRHRCKSVIQLEIMPKPPDKRTQGNWWPQWPKTIKTDYGQTEAVSLFGRDPREYCKTVKEYISDEKGAVKALQVVNVRWDMDENGRFKMSEVSGSETIIESDLVLLAMGFTGTEGVLPGMLGLELDERTNIRTIRGGYSTGIEGIFAAGDARTGQSLVVWAINEGRKAAIEVSRYLSCPIE